MQFGLVDSRRRPDTLRSRHETSAAPTHTSSLHARVTDIVHTGALWSRIFAAIVFTPMWLRSLAAVEALPTTLSLSLSLEAMSAIARGSVPQRAQKMLPPSHPSTSFLFHFLLAFGSDTIRLIGSNQCDSHIMLLIFPSAAAS